MTSRALLIAALSAIAFANLAPSSASAQPKPDDREVKDSEGKPLDCKELRTRYDDYIKARKCETTCTPVCNQVGADLKKDCPSAGQLKCS